MTLALERRCEGVALAPLHSLRFGVGLREGGGRRSFRGTWTSTPPDPTGLDVGAWARHGASDGLAALARGSRQSQSFDLRGLKPGQVCRALLDLEHGFDDVVDFGFRA